MNDASLILAPSTLGLETNKPLSEKTVIHAASTTTIKSFTSETAVLAEACTLAQVGEARRQFTNKFLQLIHESEFEYGFSTPADEYVREALHTYGSFAREWINDFFLKHYGDPFVTSAILRIIAHFDYQQMSPQGVTMAAACAAHVDTCVRECCVRCFESWGHPRTLKILQNLSFQEDWLNEYLSGVISDLERFNNVTTG